MTPGGVLVVGDVMTDIIVVPEGPLVRGSDRRASIRSRPGGSGANQAVWLGAMGVPTRFVARVAAADRSRLAAYFRSFGVAPRLVADPLRPSGVLVTIVDADGERSFLSDRGANLELTPADLPARLLGGTRLLLVSGYSFFAESPRAAIVALAAAARARGIPTAVDAASAGFVAEAGPDNVLAWIEGADLLFVNRDEARVLTGTDDLEAQLRALGRVARRVLVKLGADGAVLGGAAGNAHRRAAPRLVPIDTTGAGDAFAAAFIAADLAGAAPEDCLAAAVAAGSAAVLHVGGQPAADASPRLATTA